MSISEQAARNLAGKSSSAKTIARQAVVAGRKFMYMSEDGLREFPEGPIVQPNKQDVKVWFDEMNATPIKGFYRLKHRMFKRDSATKKRGKMVEVVTHVRGWKLANKMAKKYNAEIVRVA